MALKIQTDGAKYASNIAIEADLALQAAMVIFKNMGMNTPEYAELCKGLKDSCEKISNDIEQLKAIIPTI